MRQPLFLSKDKLLKININILRIELIELGLLVGLNHPSTILLSQKLDTLLFEYQITRPSKNQ